GLVERRIAVEIANGDGIVRIRGRVVVGNELERAVAVAEGTSGGGSQVELAVAVEVRGDDRLGAGSVRSGRSSETAIAVAEEALENRYRLERPAGIDAGIAGGRQVETGVAVEIAGRQAVDEIGTRVEAGTSGKRAVAVAQ